MPKDYTPNSFLDKIDTDIRTGGLHRGSADLTKELTWLLGWRVISLSEDISKLSNKNYKPIVNNKYNWKNWTTNKGFTGDELLHFVNNDFLTYMSNWSRTHLNYVPKNNSKQERKRAFRIKFTSLLFEYAQNYCNHGEEIRDLLNDINSVDLTTIKGRTLFSGVYENLLNQMGAQHTSGEYYTSRAIIKHIVNRIKPQIGETIADFAAGTGGFLTVSKKYLMKQAKTPKQINIIRNDTFYGQEIDPFAFILCVISCLLNGIYPHIKNIDSIGKKLSDYSSRDKVDVVMTNVPFGINGNDDRENIPPKWRTKRLENQFMPLNMIRLNKNGRASIIIMDSFLTSTNQKVVNIRKYLLDNFDLFLVERLPKSTFRPYANVNTDILYFSNTGHTNHTWFYRLDMPKGYKHFSPSHPILYKHFAKADKWWKNPKKLVVNGNVKAINVPRKSLLKNKCSLDYAPYPHKIQKIHTPSDVASLVENGVSDDLRKFKKQMKIIKKLEEE